MAPENTATSVFVKHLLAVQIQSLRLPQPKAWLWQDTTFGEQLAENFTRGSICLALCDLGGTLLSL